MHHYRRAVVCSLSCCLCLGTGLFPVLSAPEVSRKTLPSPAKAPASNNSGSQKSGPAVVQEGHFVDELGVPYKVWRTCSYGGSITFVKQQLAQSRNLNPATRHFWTGVILKCEGRADEAIGEYNQCGPLDLLSDPALIQVAYCYAEIGNPKKALELTDRIVAHGTSTYEVHRIRAEAYHAMRQFEKAVLEYEKMASIDKKQLKYSYARAAECLNLLHRYDDSIKLMTTAITDKSQPSGLFMFLTRAHCYEGAGKWSEAADDLTSAIRFAKRDHRSALEEAGIANTYMERAKCYDHMGKPDLAAKDKAYYDQLSRSLESDILGRE